MPHPRRSGARTTLRRRRGDRAEAFVAEHLERAGWRIIGRQVPVGRDELDLVAVEPGPPDSLVFLEVRSARDGRFGSPVESVVGRKAARTWRGALALVRAGRLPDGRALPGLPWRVDVVAVTGALDGSGDPDGAGHPRAVGGSGSPGTGIHLRHLRSVDPS